MRLRWIIIFALASAILTVALNKARTFQHADAVRSVTAPVPPPIPLSDPPPEGRPALPGSVPASQGIYPRYDQ
jgi:hypothetical protein